MSIGFLSYFSDQIKGRVLKYVNSKQVNDSLEQVKQCLHDPDTLVIVIMDEAHYAATSSTLTRGLSAYGEIDKILKENQLDNLLVICGTATPWNLV